MESQSSPEFLQLPVQEATRHSSVTEEDQNSLLSEDFTEDSVFLRLGKGSRPEPACAATCESVSDLKAKVFELEEKASVPKAVQ